MSEETWHGTATGYVAYGCRCAACGRANTKRALSWRTRRAAERVLVDGRLVHPHAPQHGTRSSYCNYSCRCEPCSEAQGRHMRAYKASLR